MSDDTDFEELEQIPWASLAAATPDPRVRYLGIAVLAVVAAALIGWLALRGGVDTAIPAEAPATTVAVASLPVGVAPSTTTTTEPPTYSEADLMLIDVGDEERLAVMQAEWLVRDYLTVDSDVHIDERLSTLLPGVERGDVGAYVEWAEAFTVASEEPGRYRVEVAYRLLTETGGGFVRQPAAALAVELSIDVDGTARLEAAPEEVALPLLRGLEG